MKSLSDTWSSVMDYCRGQITEVAFKTWLEPLNLVDFDGETATISTIDEFPKKLLHRNIWDFSTAVLKIRLAFR